MNNMMWMWLKIPFAGYPCGVLQVDDNTIICEAPQQPDTVDAMYPGQWNLNGLSVLCKCYGGISAILKSPHCFVLWRPNLATLIQHNLFRCICVLSTPPPPPFLWTWCSPHTSGFNNPIKVLYSIFCPNHSSRPFVTSVSTELLLETVEQFRHVDLNLLSPLLTHCPSTTVAHTPHPSPTPCWHVATPTTVEVLAVPPLPVYCPFNSIPAEVLPLPPYCRISPPTPIDVLPFPPPVDVMNSSLPNEYHQDF